MKTRIYAPAHSSATGIVCVFFFVPVSVFRSPRLVSKIEEAWSTGVVDEPAKGRRKKKK